MSGQPSLPAVTCLDHILRAVRPIVSVFLLVLVTGCASTNVEPLTNETTRSVLDARECELWDTAEKLEQQIAACVEPVEGQEEIEQYLHEVLTRVVPDFSNPHMSVRMHLLPDTSPNAFVLPNGAMYVNTGLLALLENEAQLATVLGHEFCHFRHRHSYRERIKQQNEELNCRHGKPSPGIRSGSIGRSTVNSGGMAETLSDDFPDGATGHGLLSVS